jgi:hypothetical protein
VGLFLFQLLVVVLVVKVYFHHLHLHNQEDLVDLVEVVVVMIAEDLIQEDLLLLVRETLGVLELVLVVGE